MDCRRTRLLEKILKFEQQERVRLFQHEDTSGGFAPAPHLPQSELGPRLFRELLPEICAQDEVQREEEHCGLQDAGNRWRLQHESRVAHDEDERRANQTYLCQSKDQWVRNVMQHVDRRNQIIN
ncbi:hypothetical protein WMY93_025327 [Mugilogobius chulae]|uniref:Uncharacterized protein n=1 Tax=Mugilogobius chulae TaxID=88201 RepID=A0AAW0ND58_9GOBI